MFEQYEANAIVSTMCIDSASIYPLFIGMVFCFPLLHLPERPYEAYIKSGSSVELHSDERNK